MTAAPLWLIQNVRLADRDGLWQIAIDKGRFGEIDRQQNDNGQHAAADRRRQIERIAQGMGHGVSLHGIEDKTIGQQEEDRKQDAHPTHAEPARHVPGRAAAKLSAAIAFFIQLSKGTFSKAAGHAEQGGNPHPEYGAGPTGGDRSRTGFTRAYFIADNESAATDRPAMPQAIVR